MVTVTAATAPSSVAWSFGGQQENAAFSNPVTGDFKDNSITYTISVDITKIDEGSNPLEVKAKISFTGSEVVAETSTIVYKRGIVIKFTKISIFEF